MSLWAMRYSRASASDIADTCTVIHLARNCCCSHFQSAVRLAASKDSNQLSAWLSTFNALHSVEHFASPSVICLSIMYWSRSRRNCFGFSLVVSPANCGRCAVFMLMMNGVGFLDGADLGGEVGGPCVVRYGGRCRVVSGILTGGVYAGRRCEWETVLPCAAVSSEACGWAFGEGMI